MGLDHFAGAIISAVKQTGLKTVVIKADEDARLGMVAKVMDIVKENFFEIEFAA